MGAAEYYCGVPRRQEDGKPCRRRAGWGTSHVGQGPCRQHGGNFPTVAKSAERKIAERELQRVLADLGVAEPVGNPLEALQQLAGEVLHLKDALRGMVEKLESVRYGGHAGEQLRGEVQLYERALDRAAKVLADIARLNIDERLAKLTERQVDVIIRALEAGLSAAGVRDLATRALAKAAASRELRAYRENGDRRPEALPAGRGGA